MITDLQKSEIKGFLEKYEKYWNFQDSEAFERSMVQIANDICTRLGINTENCAEVEEFIRSMYNLSDGEGLSFVLTPGPSFQYTQADQVQRIIG